MSEVKIDIKYQSYYNATMDLRPEDFLKCNTIAQLESEVRNKMLPVSINRSDIFDIKLDIPKEFIDKWKELVEFIPGNVMTRRWKERCINAEDVYTEIYTGKYLNSIRHSHNDFSLHHYDDFYFDEKSQYRCYLHDTDHWEYISTTLLYAEKIN